jgi:hypothetical protein
MVYFSLSNSMYGGGLWALIMGIGISMMYLPLIPYREVIFSLVYPLIISSIPKISYFYVNQPVIIIASVFTFLYMMLLRINKDIREALEKPLEHRTKSAAVYGTSGLVFMLAMVATSKFMPMYE